jgi:hypothetical protein
MSRKNLARFRRRRAQWTKQQAGSLFYIALLTIERRPKAILARELHIVCEQNWSNNFLAEAHLIARNVVRIRV